MFPATGWHWQEITWAGSTFSPLDEGILKMIEWFPVFANALWVLGLAVLLASASIKSYEKAVQRNTPESSAPKQERNWAQAAGLLLFCLGLMFTSDRLLERILWAAMALIGVFWPYIESLSIQRFRRK